MLNIQKMFGVKMASLCDRFIYDKFSALLLSTLVPILLKKINNIWAILFYFQ